MGVYNARIEWDGQYVRINNINSKGIYIDGSNIVVNRLSGIGGTFDIDSSKFRFYNTTGVFSINGDTTLARNAAGIFEINNGAAGTLRDLKLRSLFADKIIPNSDTTGVVIRNAADTASLESTYIAGAITEKEITGTGVILRLIDSTVVGGSNFEFILASGSGALSIRRNSTQVFRIRANGNVGFSDTIQAPESRLDVDGTTTLRDWVYLNSTGTRTTGDIVGDRRRKNILGVETVQHCTVANTTKGSGTWVVANTEQLTSLTDSNELIGAGSFIDLENARSGRGSIVFGDGIGYADFIFTSAGVVTLIQYTSNVFTSVQTGTNHVIIKDNGTNVRIVNEMGSTINFNVKIQYN